jgi:hypothetical protein
MSVAKQHLKELTKTYWKEWRELEQLRVAVQKARMELAPSSPLHDTLLPPFFCFAGALVILIITHSMWMTNHKRRKGVKMRSNYPLQVLRSLLPSVLTTDEMDKVTWGWLTFVTTSSPLISLWICLVLSIAYNYNQVLRSSCPQRNFMPSISACIGDHYPQFVFWRLNVMFYVWQRFLAAFVSYHPYHQATKGSIPLTNRFRLVAAIAENVGLMILSAVSSKDHLIVHELSFGVFAISAFIVMLLTNILIRQWIKVAERGGYEPDPRCTLATARRALSWRTRSSMISTISLILAFYFFTTSQKGYSHCRTNYWYSYFALCEWSYVVIGILFHINGEQIELWYVDWSFLYSLGGGRDGMGEGKGDSSMVVDGGDELTKKIRGSSVMECPATF